MTLMTSNAPEIRAVIFDLDGTLVDSMPLVLQAFAHALAPFRPELGIGDIFQRLGGPPARTLLELTGDEANAAEALRRFDGFGTGNWGLVEPFHGMHGLLAALQGRGLALAVWTGRDRVGTQAILAAHGLERYFTAVVCGDDFSTHKPHPEGLAAILQRLGVGPDEALYAGDADADVLGGVDAGVRTILIRHGREVESAIMLKAWRHVDGPADAYALIADMVTRLN
jgi:phosphoglycolate phosphatase-like HAD superfamily hydrolase